MHILWSHLSVLCLLYRLLSYRMLAYAPVYIHTLYPLYVLGSLVST